MSNPTADTGSNADGQLVTVLYVNGFIMITLLVVFLVYGQVRKTLFRHRLDVLQTAKSSEKCVPSTQDADESNFQNPAPTSPSCCSLKRGSLCFASFSGTSWISIFLRVGESSGKYLVMNWEIFKMLLVLSVTSIPVLIVNIFFDTCFLATNGHIHTNFSSGCDRNISFFSLTTVQHFQPESSILWVHILSYVVSSCIFLFFYMRIVLLLSLSRSSDLASRSFRLVGRDAIQELSGEEILSRLRKALPSSIREHIERVEAVSDLSDLIDSEQLLTKVSMAEERSHAVARFYRPQRSDGSGEDSADAISPCERFLPGTSCCCSCRLMFLRSYHSLHGSLPGYTASVLEDARSQVDEAASRHESALKSLSSMDAPVASTGTCYVICESKIVANMCRMHFNAESLDNIGTQVNDNFCANVIAKAPHEPSDINWDSVSRPKSSKGVRICLLRLLVCFILVFIGSGPALLSVAGSVADEISQLTVVLRVSNTTKPIRVENWLADLGKSADHSGSLGFLLHYLPSLVSVSATTLVILSVDAIARYLEPHSTHSGRERSIFSSSFLLILLNTLILPTAALSSVEALLKEFAQRSVREVLDEKIEVVVTNFLQGEFLDPLASHTL